MRAAHIEEVLRKEACLVEDRERRIVGIPRDVLDWYMHREAARDVGELSETTITWRSDINGPTASLVGVDVSEDGSRVLTKAALNAPPRLVLAVGR